MCDNSEQTVNKILLSMDYINTIWTLGTAHSYLYWIGKSLSSFCQVCTCWSNRKCWYCFLFRFVICTFFSHLHFFLSFVLFVKILIIFVNWFMAFAQWLSSMIFLCNLLLCYMLFWALALSVILSSAINGICSSLLITQILN